MQCVRGGKNGGRVVVSVKPSWEQQIKVLEPATFSFMGFATTKRVNRRRELLVGR